MGRPALLAFAVDAAWLVLFAALGRRTHDEGGAIAGTLVVAAPLVAGWALGGLAVRLAHDPLSPRRAALAWAVALPVGMALRAATGRGLAPAFLLVALAFGAVALIGWRAAVAAARQWRIRSR